MDLIFRLTYPFIVEHELKVLRSAYREQRATFDLPWPEASKRQATFRADSRRGTFAAMLLPALPAAVHSIMIADAHHRLARLAIALRRYELEHDKLL